MKRLLVVATDRALTKFIAETLLGRKINRANPHLTGNGWDIARAHSGLEALLLITRSGRQFDATVVDQSLHDRDLLAFLEQLRATREAADLPVVVMSERGRDPLSRRVATERYMVAGFIDKPVTAQSLRLGLADLKRMRMLLLVERSQLLAEEYASALRRAGYAVDIASNGRAALASVATSPPDAVICALRLDDMAGEELCARLKRSASTHTVPILLHGTQEELDSTGEIEENAHRADAFLKEPFGGEYLIEHIAPLVGRGLASTPSPPSQPEIPALLDELSLATRPDGLAAMPPSADQWERLAETQSTLDSLQEPPIGAADREQLRRAYDAAAIQNRGPDPTLSVRPRIGPSTRLAASLVDLGPSPPPASASPHSIGQAKRATRRVPCTVEVSVLDGETIYRSETLNISDGGIMITTDHPLTIGTQIELTFQLPNSASTIAAIGKVAWISKSPGGGHGSGVGVKFSQINRDDLQIIVDYTNRVSRVVYVAP